MYHYLALALDIAGYISTCFWPRKAKLSTQPQKGNVILLGFDHQALKGEKLSEKCAVLLGATQDTRLRLWQMGISHSLAWNYTWKLQDMSCNWAEINTSLAVKLNRHWAQCPSWSCKKSDRWTPLNQYETDRWPPLYWMCHEGLNPTKAHGAEWFIHVFHSLGWCFSLMNS